MCLKERSKTGSQAPGLGRDISTAQQRVGKRKEKRVTTRAQMSYLDRYGTGRGQNERCASVALRAVSDLRGLLVSDAFASRVAHSLWHVKTLTADGREAEEDEVRGFGGVGITDMATNRGLLTCLVTSVVSL